MLNSPTPRAGALTDAKAELERLGAKIDSIEKEIGDTMVELNTAKEAGDTGEVGRLSKREEALRDKEKQLRDKEKLLLERALPAPGVRQQPPPHALPPRRRSP